jgi:outer membrane lipoprotein SlyB
MCRDKEVSMDEDVRTPSTSDGETHATLGGAAAAGALVAGAIGLTGGPLAAAVGAVGGAIVGAAAERMMHSEDDAKLD